MPKFIHEAKLSFVIRTHTLQIYMIYIYLH